MRVVDKYTLSERRKKTVVAYAMEYVEWKKEYDSFNLENKGIDQSAERIRQSDIKDNTKDAALILHDLSRKIILMQQTAKEADPFIWKYILRGVTENLTYEQLFAQGLPCSRNTYYERRRRFYWLLSRKLLRMGL